MKKPPADSDYFISHATNDKDLAALFKEMISDVTGRTKKGFVSTDASSIPSGENWFNEIHEALNKCQLFLVLLTPHSSSRQWILYEYGYARSRAAVCEIIPILIGMDPLKLKGPFSSTQNKQLLHEEHLIEILKLVTTVFSSKDNEWPHEALKEKAGKFYPRIVKLIEQLEPPVNADEFGITGVFPGLLKNSPNALRSLASAKSRIIIAGPSLAQPLGDGRPSYLRSHIKSAVDRGVDVYIFLTNPVMRFDNDNPEWITSKILSNKDNSNSKKALVALKKIYREIVTTCPTKVGKLNVFLVNKSILDFAVLCDDKVVLCRSTIHWPSKGRDQIKIVGSERHDYKPPIIEANAIDPSRDSFFEEYSNYIENLMYAAELPIKEPENPDLVREIFDVQNISEAIQV